MNECVRYVACKPDQSLDWVPLSLIMGVVASGVTFTESTATCRLRV